jgi:hypothetical protein
LSGAVSNGFYVRGGKYIKIEGFTFTGDIEGVGTHMITVASQGVSVPQNIEITNNVFTGRFSRLMGGMISAEGSNHHIHHNTVTDWIPGSTEPVTIVLIGTDSVVEYNTITNSEDIDLFRAFGHGHIFRSNIVRDIRDGPLGTHMDFFQTFGNLGSDAYDIIIEKNVVTNWTNGATGQISQVCGPTSSGSTAPDVVECDNRPEMRGLVTSVSGATLTDTSKNWIVGQWGTNHWSGKVLTITTGDARGKVYIISASTDNTISAQNISGTLASLSADGVRPGDSYEIRMRVGWITYRNNVFNNISNGLSGSLPYLRIVNNTFINTAVAFTGGSPYRGRSVNGTFVGNIFISTTLPYAPQQAQIYPLGDDAVRATFTGDYNFVAKPASTGYLKHDDRCPNAQYTYQEFRFCETQFGKHGINGGDPKLDDGLRPLTGSPLCGAGPNGTDIGAYSCAGGGTGVPNLSEIENPTIATFVPTYYVSPTGNDNNTGVLASPFKTIQKCATVVKSGEQCVVQPGKYPEYIQVTRGGVSGKPVTFKAAGAVTVEGFRIIQPYVTVEGFTLTGYAVGLSPGSLTIEPSGNYCTIKNNVVKDAIQAHSYQFFFDGSGNTITNPAGGFLAAGFKPGVQFYITTNINREIKNGNKVRTVKSVTDTVITVADNEALITEGPVLSVLYATRTGRSGISGIDFVVTSGSGAASNCIVTGNTFKNLAGTPIVAKGSHHLFERNIIEDMHGFELINFVGNGITFRYNHLRNSSRYPGMEPPLPCLDGKTPGNGCAPNQSAGGHWDLVDNIVDSSGHPSIDGSNNLFEFNFIENVDNEMMRVIERWAGGGSARPARGFIIRNNVFSGIEFHGAFHRPDVSIINNTFYKSGFKSPTHAFSMSSSDDGSADGSIIKNNIFVENNIPNSTNGWYAIVSDPIYGLPKMEAPDYNFVSGPASQGYPAKLGFAGKEVNGINGCTTILFGSCASIFQNINNPIGPDGQIFTADDGLRPKAGSPLCIKGSNGTYIGAYPCGGSITAPSDVVNINTKQGDFNHDGLVNTLDFSLLVSSWNQPSTTYDLNGDGLVNTLDYAIMARNWSR